MNGWVDEVQNLPDVPADAVTAPPGMVRHIEQTEVVIVAPWLQRAKDHAHARGLTRWRYTNGPWGVRGLRRATIHVVGDVGAAVMQEVQMLEAVAGCTVTRFGGI